jgi:nucleoside 2-deoxyribosyltransferase
MKLIYIAGPYGDKGGYLAIDANIAKAREAAAWCAERGIGYFCPHLNSAHFEAITPDVPVSYWYELDIELLRKCDAILMLDGWRQSTGSKAEKAEACRLDMPVFLWPDREDLEEWAAR